jgi:cell division protein FtsN
MSTPIGRDFKRSARRNGGGLSFSRDFCVGLGIGLCVAAAVYGWQQRTLREVAAASETPRPQPRPAARRDSGVSETGSEESPVQYDFPDMLLKGEVVVPEREKTPKPEPPPTSLIERPGVYVLQPGAYRDEAEAEVLRAKLAKLGVEAVVHRVAIDADVFHRVRIGPINDLQELNRTRARLRAAEIDAVVIRVGD